MSFKPLNNFRLGVSPATINDEVVRIYQSITTVWNDLSSLITKVGTWTKDGLIYAKENNLLASTSKILTDGIKITRYNDITTASCGVPYIVERVGLSDQGAAVTTTDLASTTTSGDYRVRAYLFCNSVSGGADTANVSIVYKDPGGSGDITVTSTTITLDNLNKYTSLDLMIYHAGAGTNSITYAVAMPVDANDDTWGLRIYVERLQ